MVSGSGESDGPYFVFAGGGTGGHLYPALAVASELRALCPEARLSFWVTEKTLDCQILRSVDYEVVPQRLPAFCRLPWRWPGCAYDVWRFVQSAQRRIRVRRPNVVVGSGGLASAAGVYVAGHVGVATVLLNPDAKPGRVNRILASRADRVVGQWPVLREHLPKGVRVEVLGCPVRPEFAAARRCEGIRRFGLDPELKTILVTGASQGARTVNEAFLRCADYLLAPGDWQILHLTGALDYEAVRSVYARSTHGTAVLPFTKHMAEALAAADLVISRAGASTLAELCVAGRASILLPYPFHKDRHQYANASCLEQAGAAVIVEDTGLVDATASKLRGAVTALAQDDDRRTSMAAAARRMGKPDAARRVAELLLRAACGC